MAPEPTPAPTANEDAQTDRAVLEQLIHVGMDLVGMVRAGAQIATLADAAPGAKPGASARPLREYATAFERVARTVRRTILLKQKLAETHRAASQKRTAARKQIRGAVEHRIQSEGLKPEQAERLQDELNERLESPELDEELGHRSVADIIADIRRDLGLDGIPGTARHPTARAPRVGWESEARPTNGAPAASPPTRPLGQHHALARQLE